MIRKQDLLWSQDDRSFTLRDLRFLEVQGLGAFTDLVQGENCFLFYKMRPLVEQYLDWFASFNALRADNVVELGLYDGGSVAFWFEVLQPRKHLGIDLRQRNESKYFREYVTAEKRRGRIETHWGIRQDDVVQIPAIVDRAFTGEPIDIVFDDASHLYAESKRAFELLFPHLRAGGLYIIEDWAWFHWRGLERDFKNRQPLTDLIVDLIEVCGSTDQRIIHDIQICSGFAAVRRGTASSEELASSFVDRTIYRHPR